MAGSIVSSGKAKIAIAAIVVAAIAAAVIWLPVLHYLRIVIAWIRHLGVLGAVVFSLVFLVVCLLMLPSVELYIAAGLLYGTWWGGVLTTVLGVVVELCTLWLVHTKLRARIERRLDDHPRMAAIDRAVSEHSFSILLLLRASPLVPFAPTNYAVALAKAPVWQRIVTNVLGMAPLSFAQAYLGSLLSGVRRLGRAGPPPMWQHVLLWGGLATAVAAAVIVMWATKRVLDRESHA
ncbi:MAG TPA: VTT domain-containing protein [Kofleriaceae bacterium]|nr:VTT domain-containing protein [Kofleriaceae bacterium]